MPPTLSRRTPRRFWGWGSADATLDERERSIVKGMLSLLDARFEDRPAPQLDDFTLAAPRIRPPAALAAQFSATPHDRLNHSAGNSYADCARMWLRMFRAMLGAAKHTVDPCGILNPGVLFDPLNRFVGITGAMA